MPFVPFVQLLGHRARRGRGGKHVWHVQPIPQRECALGGGLGPWDFNGHDVWVKMPLEACPPTRETSDVMRSGDRSRLTLAPQLRKLRFREDGMASCQPSQKQ